jgi:hypothetical protein
LRLAALDRAALAVTKLAARHAAAPTKAAIMRCQSCDDR